MWVEEFENKKVDVDFKLIVYLLLQKCTYFFLTIKLSIFYDEKNIFKISLGQKVFVLYIDKNIKIKSQILNFLSYFLNNKLIYKNINEKWNNEIFNKHALLMTKKKVWKLEIGKLSILKIVAV